MDAKRLEYFKEKLKQKQQALTYMVHRTEGYGREKEPDTQDVADMAVESYTKEFLFGKSSGDRHVLQMIQGPCPESKKSLTAPARTVRIPSSPRDSRLYPGLAFASNVRDSRKKVYWTNNDCG